MSRKKVCDRSVKNQYDKLMEQCSMHMEEMDATLPPAKFNLAEELKERGVSRRDFMKWTTAMTAALMLPPMFKPMVAKAAENISRLPVVWLHFAECTGCSEAFLRTSYPNVDSILLDTIDLVYHETLMAAAGYQAEKCLDDCVKDLKGQYVCVVEGSIPVGHNGDFMRLGPKGRTGKEIASEVCGNALATICIGSCSSFGGIPAANPNPTDAKGISSVISKTTVNIAGCPPNPVNFVGTLLHFLLFKGLPPCDSLGRPVFGYGKRIHDYCERRPHYDAGEYVEEWGDEGQLKGWCLYKVGCKGPYTYANCAKARFNDGISWPIMAGHGCIGCTEPSFWDKMAPFEKPLAEKPIGLGGVEAPVDLIGAGLLGATVVGVAAHAGITLAKNHGQPKNAADDKKEEHSAH